MIELAAMAVATVATMMTIAFCLTVVGRWNRVYRDLATQYKGVFRSAQVWRKPILRFNYGEYSVQVRSRRLSFWRFRSAANRRTQVVVSSWPNRRLRLELFPHGWESPLRRQYRLNVVPIRDEPLDNYFTFRSNEPQPAERFLSAGVISQVKQLQTLLDTNQFTLSVAGGKFTVSMIGYSTNRQFLDDFIRLSLETFDQAILTLSEGIDFVAEDEATILDDVKCPICSCDILQDMVVCVRCKTPHCRDCWNYNGKCATFGCGETRFLKTASTQSA